MSNWSDWFWDSLSSLGLYLCSIAVFLTKTNCFIFSSSLFSFFCGKGLVSKKGRLLVLGVDNGGKTTLSYLINESQVPLHQPSCGSKLSSFFLVLHFFQIIVFESLEADEFQFGSFHCSVIDLGGLQACSNFSFIFSFL